MNKILIDAGENWSSNTTLGSARFQDINSLDNKDLNKDSLYISSRFGINLDKNKNKTLYAYGHFIYQNFLYGYLYPRIVNNVSQSNRYSGIPRDISRSGFISGETDISGIGFQNNWLMFHIARGRESWGAGYNTQLILSENSPSYDYLMLGSKYGNVNVKYIHGYLETTNQFINRYITARGLEWTNKKNLIIGLMEVVIYSGEKRSIDIGYLNPISTHLEIELNNRLNKIGTESSNGAWQGSLDWFMMNNFRLSMNIIFDEFVIDQIEIDKEKEHGKAFSSRLVFTPTFIKNNILSLYTTFIYVGTPTFRHGYGYNNFVQRNKPLGWLYGSDGQEYNIGLNYSDREKYIFSFETGVRKIGEESIIFRQYEEYANYLKDPFPSGDVKISNFLKIYFEYWYKRNISNTLVYNIEKNNFNSIKHSINLKLDLYFSLNSKL